jgi:hypothetical protein
VGFFLKDKGNEQNVLFKSLELRARLFDSYFHSIISFNLIPISSCRNICHMRLGQYRHSQSTTHPKELQ